MVALGMSSANPQSEVDFSEFPCKGQLLTVFSMSTLSQVMAFIRLLPGCLECSHLRTAYLSFVGTTIRSQQISDTHHGRQGITAPLELLKVSLEIRRLWMSEKLANFLYHWILLYFSFNFHLSQEMFKYNRQVCTRNHPQCWWQQ